MMTVEDLLGAFALAHDAWLDPEVERENPLPEYAALIRQAVSVENDALRELVRAAWKCIHTGASCSDCRLIAGGCTLQTAMRELGIEVDE